MVYPIRLGGPWTCRPLEAITPTDVPAEGTVSVPGTWAEFLGERFRGRVRFIRRFGRPSGLTPGTRVELVIDSVEGQADVRLDDHSLASGLTNRETPFRVDITARLQFRNELAVDVYQPDPTAPAGGLGAVRIEIM